MSKSVHVEITGRVQGVGYRAWCDEEARRLGLSGWVRNTRAGAVEAVFSGDEAAVDAMLEAARQGPACSSVTDVSVLAEVESYDGDFEIRSSE